MKRITIMLIFMLFVIDCINGLDIHVYQGVDTIYSGANIVPESSQNIGAPDRRWAVGFFNSLPGFSLSDSINAQMDLKLDTSWWNAWRDSNYAQMDLKLDTSWWNAWRDSNDVCKYIEIYIAAEDSVSCQQNNWMFLHIWTQGLNNNISLLGDSVIVLSHRGIYILQYSLSVQTDSIGHRFIFGISTKNEAPLVKTRALKKLDTESDIISGNCILNLSTNDSLRAAIIDSTGNGNIRFMYGNIIIKEIKNY